MLSRGELASYYLPSIVLGRSPEPKSLIAVNAVVGPAAASNRRGLHLRDANRSEPAVD